MAVLNLRVVPAANGSWCRQFELINMINDGGNLVNQSVMNAISKRVHAVLGLLGRSEFFNFG